MTDDREFEVAGNEPNLPISQIKAHSADEQHSRDLEVSATNAPSKKQSVELSNSIGCENGEATDLARASDGHAAIKNEAQAPQSMHLAAAIINAPAALAEGSASDPIVLRDSPERETSPVPANEVQERQDTDSAVVADLKAQLANAHTKIRGLEMDLDAKDGSNKTYREQMQKVFGTQTQRILDKDAEIKDLKRKYKDDVTAKQSEPTTTNVAKEKKQRRSGHDLIRPF